ncbi:MAG: TonB family protein [Pyrinomonadaceae bacterium]
MLDHLVESTDHARETKRLSGFMLSTSILMIAGLTAGMIYSLFNHNLVLSADGLEISTLVAPVPLETEPQPIDEPSPPKEEKRVSEKTELPTRKENIQRTDESPISTPPKISTTPSQSKARPKSSFIIDSKDTDPVNKGNPQGKGTGRNTEGPIKGIDVNNGPVAKVEEKTEEPPPIVKPTPKKEVQTISGGVVNGKAIRLVTPVYPAPAKNLGLKGQVKVQVTIDENGRVISAQAVSGHALLRNSAVAAARESTFSPTTLSKQKVKVTGFIVYNFS